MTDIYKDNLPEKDMELDFDKLEQVSGGAGPIETVYTALESAGLLPRIASLPPKEAVLLIRNYCNQNGLAQYSVYANAVYSFLCLL